jgi:hypothetical protein
MRTLAGVTVGIIVPLVLIPLAALGGYLWYRRKMKALAVDGEAREVPGVRLTSETLRRLPHPPWRVVYEIRPAQLEGADHVVVGPCGVIALTTVVADRPGADRPRESAMVASSNLVRAAVDEHTRPTGLRCDRIVKVYWGAPQPDSPAAQHGMNGTIDVEGQRLEMWLHSLPPAGLPPERTDAAWRAIVVGIGRPDPLG